MWTWTKKLILPVMLALFVLMGAADIGAQVVFGQPTMGQTQVVYYNWTVEYEDYDATISQFMIPVTGFIPVKDNFDLNFFVANSSNTVEIADTDFELAGLGDFRMQANHSFADDRLLLSAAINLPTGKKELDFNQEWLVLKALSLNFLELPMRRFGEGFGFSLLAGGALPLTENIRVGAGVMFQYIGEYKPYVDYGDYDPGDLFSINGGFDYETGGTIISLDAIYSSYMADKLDGTKNFKQSEQIDVRLSARHMTNKLTVSGLARYVARGKNREYDSLGYLDPAMDPYKLYGNEFTIAGSATWVISEGWDVAPSADLRLVGGNDIGFEKSTIIGFGATLGRRVTENFHCSAGGKLFTGNANDSMIDLSGYQLTFALTATM